MVIADIHISLEAAILIVVLIILALMVLRR